MRMSILVRRITHVVRGSGRKEGKGKKKRRREWK